MAGKEKQRAALILAAGAGTRMCSDMPKVLHRIGGKSLVEHILLSLKEVQVTKSVVVVGFGREAVIKALRSYPVSFAIQKQQLGTAHAVRAAAANFKNYAGQVLVLAGDVPLIDPGTLKQFFRFHEKSGGIASVLTTELASPKGYGRIIRDAKGCVQRIVEELDASEDERRIHEINSGIYLFQARQLFLEVAKVKQNQKKREFYLTDVIESLVRQGIPVAAFASNDPFLVRGVNSREDLVDLNAVMNTRNIQRLLRSGVTVYSPETTVIERDVFIGRDTVIYPFTYIESNVRIAANCQIGPFCKIRSGSTIGSGCTVGSFVEVNRSHLKTGVTAKHLAYLGDTTVGSNANIGAGVVTANFDGKHKHQTVIDEGAFIGSNTVLVAPVKIGKGARTGAGAVVRAQTKVPKGRTAVGVPARIL